MSLYLQYDVKNKLDKLASNVTSSKIEILSNLLHEIIKQSNGKIDEEEEFIQSIVNLIHIQDVHIKKQVYFYMSMLIKHDNSIYLRISNHIRKDCSHNNAVVRMCGYRFLLNNYKFIGGSEEILSIILQGLTDAHPNVKCLILSKLPFLRLQNTENFAEIKPMVMKLLKEESSSLVVIRCIKSLIEMNDIQDFSMLLNLLHQIKTLEIKAKYLLISSIIDTVDIDKISHEESFQVLNILEHYISSPQRPYFSMICLKLMLLVSSKFAKVHFDVKVRAVNHILKFLEIAEEHTEIFLLSNLSLLIHSSDKLIPLFRSIWTMFLITPTDLPYCCVYKIKILSKLKDKDNSLLLLRECCKVILKNYSTEATAASMNLLTSLCEFHSEKCVSVLMSLLNHKNLVIINHCIESLLRIYLQYENIDLKLDRKFVTLVDKLETTQSRVAFLTLLFNFEVNEITFAHFIASNFSDILKKWKCTNCEIVMPNLLFYTLKLFLKFPHVFKKLFYQLNENSINHKSDIISGKSRTYLTLLKQGVKDTQTLIFSSDFNPRHQTKILQNWNKNIYLDSPCDDDILNF